MEVFFFLRGVTWRDKYLSPFSFHSGYSTGLFGMHHHPHPTMFIITVSKGTKGSIRLALNLEMQSI